MPQPRTPNETRTAPRPGQLSALLLELARVPEDGAGAEWERALRPGAMVGRFELLREIGRGGFGVVYEARDHELGRRVAFKAVRASQPPEVTEERLLREAEAAAQLSHPNIVTLHDVGRTEHGPYLVLELLEGETLARLLRKGPITVVDAMHVGVEVARALAHAHAHGVVHRDLKPANVFVCTDGQVKVLDFGLAHAFGHRQQAGGTPGYMAPEQAEDAPEDERSDVWALGVILFEMLSGRRPFADQGSLEKPAPMLDMTGAPGLGDLVARMLATSPMERPRDGAEVLAALERIERELLRARSGATAAPVRIRRRGLAPGWLLATSVVAAVIAGVSGWALRTRYPSTRPTDGRVALAVLPLANLSGDAGQEYFSDGITDEITGKLSRIRGLAVSPRSSVAKYKGSHKNARDIGRELGVAYAVEGSIRRAGDRIRVSTALVRTADASQVWSEILDGRLDDVFDVQERVATRVVEALHVHLTADELASLGRSGTRSAAAYDEYLRGRALMQSTSIEHKMAAAQRHLERALQIDPSFAPAMVGLANTHSIAFRLFDPDPERMEKARTLLDRALELDPKASNTLTASGLVRGFSYDYRGAAHDFRRATALDPRAYWAWGGLCLMLGYMTPPDLAEAESACRRSLQLNPAWAEAYYNLAKILAQQGRVAEARRAIDHLAEQSPQSPEINLGWFWIHLGANRPWDALDALDGVSGQFTRSALGRSWRAMALARAGDLDGAFAALDDALASGWRDVDQLRLGSYFEPLGRDPRFVPLLAKYGIAPPPRR